MFEAHVTNTSMIKLIHYSECYIKFYNTQSNTPTTLNNVVRKQTIIPITIGGSLKTLTDIYAIQCDNRFCSYLKMGWRNCIFRSVRIKSVTNVHYMHANHQNFSFHVLILSISTSLAS